MADPRGHATGRLLPFTDAVVAIAMTLLVLPLVEISTQVAPALVVGETSELFDVLQESIAPLIGFAISFFVIARLWWAHHAIFETVPRWTTAMVVANVAWLFTIVLIPWVTTFATTFIANRLVALLYVGTMTASSALQTLLAWLVVRSAQIRDDRGALRRYYGNLATLVAFGVALTVCVAFPATLYIPLALLAFTPLVDRRIERRLARSSVVRP